MGTKRRQAWPKIRKRHTNVKGARYSYWVVDCGFVEGRRLTFNYRTSRDAEKKADELRLGRNAIGADALRLSDDQLREAAKAYRALDGQATLQEAVDFFLAHHNPTGGQRTVAELLKEFIDAKTKANRRATTVRDMQYKIGKFAAEFGDTPVHKVTTHDIEKWLDKHGYTKITRRNFRTVFTGFFNFAMKRGLVRANPAVAIEKPIIDEKIPEIFTPEEAKKLLLAALEHDARMVPYFAIALFAGIRPIELQQLDWRNIDLNAKRIRVIPETAKKRRQRYVDISDNLVEWLLPHRQESGLVFFSRGAFEYIRLKGNIRWAGDICRHSFGSYHLAMHDNAALTSLQMGHQGTDVLFEHYRDIVTREDAKAFWSIRPVGVSQVVQLSDAG